MSMFQNEERKKFSCKFLSLLFEIDYNYLLNSLKLSKNETNKKLESQKIERCDYVVFRDGINEGKSDIAKRMLNENANINFISRITGLTINEMNDLK